MDALLAVAAADEGGDREDEDRTRGGGHSPAHSGKTTPLVRFFIKKASHAGRWDRWQRRECELTASLGSCGPWGRRWEGWAAPCPSSGPGPHGMCTDHQPALSPSPPSPRLFCLKYVFLNNCFLFQFEVTYSILLVSGVPRADETFMELK